MNENDQDRGDGESMRIIAQRRRMEAYESGEYELSEDEGFHCEDCDWRGLVAPMSEHTPDEIAYQDEALCMCPECGGDAYTKDSDTDFLDSFKPETTDTEDIDSERENNDV